MPTMLEALRFKEMHYTAEQRAEDTLLFIGSNRYHDLEVRVLHIAENGVVVVSEGMHRVVLWQDLSFSSEHIARQNQGRVVLLKIRKWQ